MEKQKKKSLLTALFAPIDMTEGRPGSRIVMFAIPMLIGNIAQQALQYGGQYRSGAVCG